MSLRKFCYKITAGCMNTKSTYEYKVTTDGNSRQFWKIFTLALEMKVRWVLKNKFVLPRFGEQKEAFYLARRGEEFNFFLIRFIKLGRFYENKVMNNFINAK